MAKINTKERILTKILEKYNANPDKLLLIYKQDFSELKLDAKLIIKSLLEFQQDDLIVIHKKSVHNDFSIPWNISLTPKGLYYFENKKQKQIATRREWVRTYLPITISAIALIKSFWPEIILIMRLIGQLWKQ